MGQKTLCIFSIKVCLDQNDDTKYKIVSRMNLYKNLSIIGSCCCCFVCFFGGGKVAYALWWSNFHSLSCVKSMCSDHFIIFPSNVRFWYHNTTFVRGSTMFRTNSGEAFQENINWRIMSPKQVPLIWIIPLKVHDTMLNTISSTGTIACEFVSLKRPRIRFSIQKTRPRQLSLRIAPSN